MKIGVIFTGGTIGSTVKDGWISTDEAKKYLLLENYRERFGDDITFIPSEPYYLLSENLSADKLNLLMKAINGGLSHDFDGIIVTHGTDTLHFSAAAAHHAFNDNNKPIVFVSANFPLEDSRSNGHANFEGAVALIKSGIKSGVCISYANPDGKHYIHKADKALSFSESDDSIYSLGKKPFAVFENETVKILDKIDYTSSLGVVSFCESPKILVITAMPEDSFEYNIEKYNAVILRPYHSGTLNTQSFYFKEFLKHASQKDVPVFLANAPSGTTYETVKEYETLGIISLPDITFASLYIKIWAGISENKNLKNLF